VEDVLKDLDLDGVAARFHAKTASVSESTGCGAPEEICGKCKIVIDIAATQPQYLVSDCITAQLIAAVM
jgi:hypothetical protein